MRKASVYPITDSVAEELIYHLASSRTDVDLHDRQAVIEAVVDYLEDAYLRLPNVIFMYDIMEEFGRDDDDVANYLRWSFGEYDDEVWSADDVEWYGSDPYDSNAVKDWFVNSSNAYGMLVDELVDEVVSNADYIRGACRSENAARKTALLDDDVYWQSMQIVDEVEGELDHDNAYYSHDALLSMYDIMRDAIDAFATSKFLDPDDESLLSRQWREAIDRTEDFLDVTGSVFMAGEVVHAYTDVFFAKHDRPYFRDVYGSRKG